MGRKLRHRKEPLIALDGSTVVAPSKQNREMEDGKSKVLFSFEEG